MKVAGIVAEYNPFHTGHAHQIEQTREALGTDTGIIAVMSGNWVQQADCAIADKWVRTRLAVMGGADLVLELPTLWAASTAESFARGAVDLLHATGVVDVLSFGSECGNADKLQQVAACLDSPAYHAGLSRFLDDGMTFAAARQSVVHELLGEDLSSLLSTPNNNLGIEYIRALNALKSDIHPMTVLRKGAPHNSLGVPETGPRFVSATAIRGKLKEGAWDWCQPYLVSGGRAVLEHNPAGLPSLEQIERATLARVRTMTADDWGKLPDSGVAEGLPRRLEQAGRTCTCMEEFYQLVKTKRYTHARLRRLVLWAYLGLAQTDRPDKPPYLRVLGFNTRGRELLKQMKKTASLPILTKPAHAQDLDDTGCRLFQLEARCTDLYDLCFRQVPTPGREWTTGPVILSD